MTASQAAETLGKHLKLPIVFLTNDSEETTWKSAKAAHAFGYVHKSLDDRELKTAIEMAFYKREAEEELHRSNRLYATLSQVNQAVVRMHTREEILQEVCRVVVEVGGFTNALIGWLEPSTRKIDPVAFFGIPKETLAQLSFSACDLPEGDSPTGTAVREERWVVANDLQNVPQTVSWHQTIAQLGLRAIGSFPIRFRGKVCSALSVASAKNDFFQEKEILLLQEIAADVSFALDKLEEETKRKQVEQQLKEGEERYRRLVELSPDTVLIHCEGKVIFINPAGLKLFGATHAGQILGTSVMDLIHPSFRETVARRVRTMEDNCSTVALLEEKILRLDGTSLDVEVTAAGFVLSNKPAVQVMLRDISARKMMESRFLRDQRIETIGGLASGIAHDLNNVLAPIVMTVSLLRDKCEDEDTLALIGAMETSAHRGAGIIQQLLTFGRGASGQRSLIEPKHLLNEVAEIARETFPKNIEVKLNARNRDWLVKGDPTQLHQVFLNLCVNARDAMPAGGRLSLSIDVVQLDELHAEIKLGAKDGHYVVFAVKDTGKGVPVEIRDKIFEPFFTTKQLGKGTGLGLATCVNLVKKHGGFIDLVSEPERGAEFKVFLPAAASCNSSIADIAKPNKLPDGNGEVILLVDDEESIRKVARTALQTRGYKVLTANDGAQAISIFSENKDQIRLIFIDVMMPVMGGPAAMREIRALDSKVPMIATSGMIPKELERELAELKSHGFVAKPFTTEQLLTAIAAALAAGNAA